MLEGNSLSLGGNGEREGDNFKKIAPLKLLKWRGRIRVLFSFPLSSISLRVQSVFFFLCARMCVQNYLNNDSPRLSPDNHCSVAECVQMTGSSEAALTKPRLPTHFSFPYQI